MFIYGEMNTILLPARSFIYINGNKFSEIFSLIDRKRTTIINFFSYNLSYYFITQMKLLGTSLAILTL